MIRTLGLALALAATNSIPAAAQAQPPAVSQDASRSVRFSVAGSAGLPELLSLQAGVLVYDHLNLEARLGYVPLGSLAYGGSATALVPLAGDQAIPRHALVIGLGAMRDPRLRLSHSSYEGVGFYAETMLGYGFTAQSGLHVRLTGGATVTGDLEVAPALRLGFGWFF